MFLKDAPIDITFDERAFEVAQKGMKTDGKSFFWCGTIRAFTKAIIFFRLH
ncbi:MAG: hypothetical protein L6V93_18460 [Clostridiales bacterium]|nr:MAG: hypothetical protein L6V93_18460 [Clostridiales bacterium]